MTYRYDNDGDLASVTDSASGITSTYYYDYVERLMKYRETGGEHSLTVAYGYDSVNNLTSQTITVDSASRTMLYTYDDVNRITQVQDGSRGKSYTYDADGIRTSKTVNGTKHTYYYAGGKLLRETFGSNTLDFFYDASGNPYALKHNGTTYYYITNLQGDVMSIVNGSGTVVASYQYDPFGNLVSTEPAANSIGAINPLRYRGYVYDTESRLYYLQSRYYDPEMGRFINADALASTGLGILGFNMFAYCRNNPASRVDVSGYIDEEVDLDGETKDDLFPEPIGGGTSGGEGTVGTGYGSSTAKGLNFSSNESLMDHYARHNKEFGNAFETPQEYVDTANYVIENGEYVTSQNAYVKFYGMNGRANYAFVGISSDHLYITTFHLKQASQICFD